jgi:hypothetical protein
VDLGVEKNGIFRCLLESTTAIWYILWPFGNLLAIWYIFTHFGTLCQEKSGNPVEKQHFYTEAKRKFSGIKS